MIFRIDMDELRSIVVRNKDKSTKDLVSTCQEILKNKHAVSFHKSTIRRAIKRLDLPSGEQLSLPLFDQGE